LGTGFLDENTTTAWANARSAAAIANAIFHATGKRVRDLPITPDKLI
jgi:hypothetical protein